MASAIFDFKVKACGIFELSSAFDFFVQKERVRLIFISRSRLKCAKFCCIIMGLDDCDFF